MPVAKLGTKVFCVEGCNPLRVAQRLGVGVAGHEKEKLIPLLHEYAHVGLGVKSPETCMRIGTCHRETMEKGEKFYISVLLRTLFLSYLSNNTPMFSFFTVDPVIYVASPAWH